MTHPNKASKNNSDVNHLNLQKEMLGLPFNVLVLLKDAKYMLFSRNRKRINLKNDIHYTHYYSEFGDISQLQLLLPVQLLSSFSNYSHGTASKHSGISQMMQKNRPMYYFP